MTQESLTSKLISSVVPQMKQKIQKSNTKEKIYESQNILKQKESYKTSWNIKSADSLAKSLKNTFQFLSWKQWG